MLFDPRHDMWSLPALRDWLSHRDPDDRYDYSRCDGCLLAQYFKAKTGKRVIVGAERVTLDGIKHKLPKGWNEIAAGNPVDPTTQTFGRALARAEKVLEAQYV